MKTKDEISAEIAEMKPLSELTRSPMDAPRSHFLRGAPIFCAPLAPPRAPARARRTPHAS